MDESRSVIASYCTSSAWGGLEMNVLRFLRWMHERNWETILLAPPDSELHRRALDTGTTVGTVNHTQRLGDIVNAWRLVRQARAHRVGILVVHQSPDILPAVIARIISRKSFRLIYSQHMHVGGNKRDPFHSWEYGHFDAWVTPIRWLADRVIEKTTIPSEKIHVVTRGIELQPFTEDLPDKKVARQSLRLPENALLAGLIGRLDPKKGQVTAVRALARVRQSGYPLHLLLVGAETAKEDNDYTKYLRELAQDLGVSDQIHMRPHQERPEYAYAALDMFVLASKSETYGMVTIEASASGLPIIGTAEGGTLDLIRHEGNGLLFPPMNDEALAIAMIRYIEDSSFATRMASQAKQDAIAKYSHVRQCDDWELLLRQLER